MKKYKYIKNPLFQLCLVLLMTNCGGGGGGSNAPRSITPTKTIAQPKLPENKPSLPESKPESKPEIPVNPDKPVVTPPTYDKDNKVVKGILPNSLTFSTPVIPSVETKGESLVVGVLDSDFLTHKADLKKKYGDKIVILEKDEKNYTDHGELVLDTLLEGISPKVVASSLSSKYGKNDIIKFSLDDYKKILNEMKKADKEGEKKLKIFNQSWGSTLAAKDESYIYSNKSTTRAELLKGISNKMIGTLDEIKKSGQESLNFYDDTVNNENGLFIWANGNLDINDQVLNNAGIQAAAPIVKKSLEKGWISVVGIDGNENNQNYSPKHLAYSGIASNWSISANGNAGSKYGSSFAAPRVSNAAVQVGSKFPWMSNNEVRMTLFTTTNKVGVGNGIEESKRYLDSQADNKNGWGVLNKERALKGPGAFWEKLLATDYKNLDNTDWRYYFDANLPKNNTSYFENNIYGDSGLKKRGEGTLILTGENKFAGKTKIEEGTLEIYKTHNSGIDIEKNGTLVLHNDAVVGYKKYELGDGEKFSPVNNGGNLKLTGNSAYLGEYINKDGKLTIPQGAKLTVLNNADIDKLVVNLEADGYVSSNGKNLNILEAKNISGEIDNINTNGMRNISLEKSEDKLVVHISRENAANYLGEAGRNSKDTAEKIEVTLKELDEKAQKGTLSDDEKELGTTILSMSNSDFKKSTEIVSGEIYASAQALNFIQAQNINRGLSNHLASLKDFYASDFNWQGWTSFQGSNGKFTKSGYASADTKINGGHFGIDRRIDNNQIGVAISFSNGEANFDRYAGRYTSVSLGISLYGKKYLANNSYILSRIGVTNFETEVRRTLLTQDGSLQTGKIKHDDTMYSTYFETGKDFKYVTPYIAYSLDILNRDGFSENSSWGIVAKDKKYIQQNLIAGVRGEYSVNETLKLTSHLSQQFNIGDRDLSFKGHFNNSSTEHRFKGINQIQNTTWVGIGADKKFSDNFGVSVNLDMRFDEFKKADTLVSTNLYYRF